jgi:trk system potassium uptake protein TrkA
MKVIIVGCGRLGIELAERLLEKKFDLSIIDSVRAAFNSLPSDFQGQTVEGEALNQDVLVRAGIEKADALAAVTNSDPLNAIVAHIAKTVYHVPHVVVRNYDPRWREVHEIFGSQIVSSTSWGAQRIEELIDHAEVKTIYSAGNGEVEVYELFNGRTLGELMEQENCLPVSLTRAGTAILPNKDTVLVKDDVITFSATNEGVQHIRKCLAGKMEA